MAAASARHPGLPNEASFYAMARALAMERNDKWFAKRDVDALRNVMNAEVVTRLAA